MHDNPHIQIDHASRMTQQPHSRWAPVLCCLLFVTLARADDTTDTTDVWIHGHWQGPKLGQPMDPEDINGLPQHVRADGRGLPAGEGNAIEGGALYAQLCASCHGSRGQGGKALELVGDRSLLATEFPDRGIAVYWPNAPTLFDPHYLSMSIAPCRLRNQHPSAPVSSTRYWPTCWN